MLNANLMKHFNSASLLITIFTPSEEARTSSFGSFPFVVLQHHRTENWGLRTWQDEQKNAGFLCLIWVLLHVLLKILHFSYLCSTEIYVLRSRHFELLILFCVTKRFSSSLLQESEEESSMISVYVLKFF